ncbi:MAG: hypothetical protein J5I93_27435 [Pirellulaceae bacterium]|nr:hypothetical protein [Pirellulaceae bacterium]
MPADEQDRAGGAEAPARGAGPLAGESPDEVFDAIAVGPAAVEVKAVTGRHPLRFGIGGLMVLVTVLAFQYALINYLGPIAAMAIPPVVCGFLVLAVLVGELYAWRLGQLGPQLKSRELFGWLLIYIFVLGLSAYLAGGAQIGYGWFTRWRLERQLQQDLGFKTVPGYLFRRDGSSQATLFLAVVEPGGAVEQSLLRSGDAVLTELTPAEWFRMLNENRGQSVDVTVVRGAPGKMLEDCPTSTHTLLVPAARPMSPLDFF